MNNFEFCSPTKFIFGRGVEAQVGQQVKAFGGSKVLVHYGGGSAVRSGLIDRVTRSLADAGIEYLLLGGAQPNPRSGLVYEGITLARQNGVDFVLGVGGGSAIDSSKAIAVGSRYDGDFWDFYTGKATPESALPIGVVLTMSAAGSEGSTSAVITQEDGMYKRGLNTEFNRPKFSIMNPELTMTLPPYQVACGVVDMMAHVLERYFTTQHDVDLTDRMCESVLSALVKAGAAAVANPKDYNAQAQLMWAGTIAHNGVLGVGRKEDWASHQLEHELSALYDVAHGAGLAVVFPAWMRYQIDVDVNRFAQLAVRVWGCDMDFYNPKTTALEGIERFETFLRSIGMPVTFAELGAKKEDIPALSQKVKYGPDGKVGDFRPLTPDMVAEVFKLACR